MGVADDFKTFCSNLIVLKRDSISYRNGEITKRLNKDFYSSDSDTYHSFYAGSFGRDTAIGLTSDVDMVFVLPTSVYYQYNSYENSGQSALLQAVRESIRNRYSVTEIGADGQVVVVPFDDGIKFEVLPAFLNHDNQSYTYPDSNNGGSWRVTNPKPEIDAINQMDKQCNYNLKFLCKMMRAWKVEWDVPIGGLLIDTLTYNFIQNWSNRDQSILYYDWMSRDFFQYMKDQNENQNCWKAPGSGQNVYRRGNFEYKALRCYNLSLGAIKCESEGRHWKSNQSWREICGSSFPE